MLARIQLVKSVTPLATTSEQKYECEHSEKQTTTGIASPAYARRKEKKTEKQNFIKDKAAYIPNDDLEGLTAEQKITVQEMLQEECESILQTQFKTYNALPRLL